MQLCVAVAAQHIALGYLCPYLIIGNITMRNRNRDIESLFLRVTVVKIKRGGMLFPTHSAH